jgi:monoterpene epsilon-lactone hydrolase
MDAHRVLDKADRQGVAIAFHEAPGAQHVYPLLPTPEGSAGRKTIAGPLTP